MNKIIALLCCCFAVFQLSAQPKGYSSVKNVNTFQQSLAQANSAKQTIQSDFTQVKHLSLLADKIKSKGKFYFKKEDKVRIEYTDPYYYLLVMNGGQIMVKDEQKSSKVNTRNSKTMQSVNRIMIDCMRGTVFQNPDFKVSAYENANGYLLSLVPSNDAMKKMFKQIDVYMDKKNFDVSRLTMTETGGDYTDMDFTNTQHNVALNETLFKIK
ncbi:outer membrane lipoprotein carrier protein LolA [Taibaiella soli]|uniref:Outer membrane lipoprotein carrier protein LolA n=1 Tax=Taibaiella soli TaxID=1649169 RepID=A0A2W2BD45_9BACT|nr:outer membrane lipoprotein carrier protein LolA [Taibaiella soli]PZF74169.1 outer membrane lipoprotein carrier protein LolA [Taibaiella soli]